MTNDRWCPGCIFLVSLLAEEVIRRDGNLMMFVVEFALILRPVKDFLHRARKMRSSRWIFFPPKLLIKLRALEVEQNTHFFNELSQTDGPPHG